MKHVISFYLMNIFLFSIYHEGKVFNQISSLKSIINKNEIEICSKTIKYTINKIKILKDGKEIKTNITIIVNPTTKTINLLTEDKTKGKVNFVTNILRSECSLDGSMITGEATYKGYVLQQDKTKTPSTIHIKANGGDVSISELDPEGGRSATYSMIVTKWELFN